MASTELLDEYYDYLIARQNEYSVVRREILELTGEIFCRWLPGPEMQPLIQPALLLNTSLVNAARQIYREAANNVSSARRCLLSRLGYVEGGKPLTANTMSFWDVRPVIVDRVLSYVWYKAKHLEGYRLLTRRVAAALHRNGTRVFIERYSQNVGRRVCGDYAKIRQAVELVNPEQAIINNQQQTIYRLSGNAKKRSEISILPVSPSDHDFDHMWLYKPARRSRPL